MGNIEWLPISDLPADRIGGLDGVLTWFYGEPMIAFPVEDDECGIGWWINGDRYTKDQPTAWAEVNPPS